MFLHCIGGSIMSSPNKQWWGEAADAYTCMFAFPVLLLLIFAWTLGSGGEPVSDNTCSHGENGKENVLG